MDGFGLLVFSAISWAIPIVIVVFLFRTLATIVEGLRSINAASQRIAAAVEALAAKELPPPDVEG